MVLHYNDEALTSRCLASLNKARPDCEHELTVLDNGSKKKFSSSDCDFVIRLPKNVGNICGQNACFQYAKYPWVLFVSNDVEFQSDAIRELWKMRNLSNAGQIQPVSDNFGMDYHWPGYGLNRTRFISHKTPITPSITYLMKKDIWEFIGVFDETLPGAYEDVDMGLKLGKAGYVNYVIEKAMAKHGGNKTLKYAKNDKWRFREARKMVIEKHFKGLDRWLRLRACDLIHAIQP